MFTNQMNLYTDSSIVVLSLITSLLEDNEVLYLIASSSLLTLIDLNSFSSLIYFMLLFDILLAPLDNLWAALYKSEFVFV